MSYISAMEKKGEILTWERNSPDSRTLITSPADYYFYVNDRKGIYTTIYNTQVRKLEFDSSNELRAKAAIYRSSGTATWEDDISATYRLLSDRYYKATVPKLNLTHLDIEVDYDPVRGFSSPEEAYAPINALAMFHEHTNHCVLLCVSPPLQNWTHKTLKEAAHKECNLPVEYETEFIVCANEKQLLKMMLLEIQNSDVLSAWNGEGFDFPYIGKRVLYQLGKKFFAKLSFDGDRPPQFKEKIVSSWQTNLILECRSRIYADYMLLYKKYEMEEKQSYKLESVSDEVLVNSEGKPILPKLEYQGSLATLYVKNFPLFVRYNIRDTEILRGFELKLGYVALANEMYHSSTGLFNGVLGTIKLSELAVINHAHHELCKVVNSVKENEVDGKIGGALVMFPQVGMHEWISSVDIASLYPSAIRSINISPEMIIGQFFNNEADYIAISQKSSEEVELIMERGGEPIIKTGKDWYNYLWERKWCVSGFGTVFSQEEMGIMPSILADWYAQRKAFQKKKNESLQIANDILAKYK